MRRPSPEPGAASSHGVDYTPLHLDRIKAIRNNDAKVCGNWEGVLAGN